MLSPRPSLSLIYIVPTHNDGALIEITTRTLIARLHDTQEVSFGAVVLVENGSLDDTAARASALEGTRDTIQTIALSLHDAGIGYAYHAGLLAGLALAKRAGVDLASTWLILTASDLPFGFSDLDGFLAAHRDRPTLPIAIGSKAHPHSTRRRSLMRNLATLTYRLARRAFIGMRTGDSQGSFFVRADFIEPYLAHIQSRDYFYTTELVYLVERDGVLPLELAVTLEPESRPSTVKPLADGKRMLRALYGLRRRNR